MEHLREDLAAAGAKLSPEVVAQAEALIDYRTVHGNRYNEQSRGEVDTEEF